jgi:hypothetical protein
MEPIFVHRGKDRRDLGDPVADRLGVITGQGVAAPAASGRLALEDLAELPGGASGRAWRCRPGCPPRFWPEAGVGGRRLTGGGSEEGGLEESVEFLLSRCSRSAIRCSREATLGLQRLHVHLQNKTGLNHPMKLLRKTSATLIESHELYGRYTGHFLGHAPSTIAERHYAAPSMDLFDRIVLWLGDQYGKVVTDLQDR